MFFIVCLYIALAIFVFGLLFKISTWFRYTVGSDTGDITPLVRVSAGMKGIFLTLFSPQIITLLKVFVFDVLFQLRIYRENHLRWVMHMCIFGGFMLLLLMHPLDDFITSSLDPDYSATLNPFLFLRNLFAVIIMVGLGIAVYRRVILKVPRLFTSAMDRYSIMVLAIIMISGFFLEGTKILSYTNFQKMVEDYADSDDKKELRALEGYWVERFGIVSPNLKRDLDESVLAEGAELHEMSCAGCHSRPQWAPVGYTVATVLRPIASGLDRADLPTLLLYIHFLACFIGLAYLPFSKMFHIFTGPLSLLMNAVMDREKSDPANLATKLFIELDACTHCGTCSLRCSVSLSFAEIPNVNIFPSEKMASVKAFVRGKKLGEKDLRSIQEGLFLCTNCYRCTTVCPVGINLQDLWFDVREAMLQKGHSEFLVLSPLSFYRGLKRDGILEDHYRFPVQIAKKALDREFKAIDAQESPITLKYIDKEFYKKLSIPSQGNTFSYCFTCKTCTTSCPVARNFENPVGALGLVPHQIIHAVALGLTDPIFSSNMLWKCLGCYQCQENCPQGVCVTDVFYELKNMALKQIKEKSTPS